MCNDIIKEMLSVLQSLLARKASHFGYLGSKSER